MKGGHKEGTRKKTTSPLYYIVDIHHIHKYEYIPENVRKSNLKSGIILYFMTLYKEVEFLGEVVSHGRHVRIRQQLLANIMALAKFEVVLRDEPTPMNFYFLNFSWWRIGSIINKIVDDRHQSQFETGFSVLDPLVHSTRCWSRILANRI